MLNTIETASRRPHRHLLNLGYCAAAVFTFTSPVTAQDEPLKEIYAQIEHIKAGNEELRTLLVEQRALLDLAKEDPIAARNSLKPYSDCVNSVLKPYCPWFRASFKPEISSTPAVPKGPPLTGRAREGLVLAVQKCWNVPIGLQNADDLAVVVAVDLTPDGKLASSPQLIYPAGTPTGATKQAFEAARRALIRCEPYDLPSDKYEQWQHIEVVFNSDKMVVTKRIVAGDAVALPY